MEQMSIGELAGRAGVATSAVRYYERRGLLPKPPRRTSGYREFPDDAVRIVRFIKRAQDLGFSLDEVEELLQLRRNTGRHRAQIRALATRRVEDIDRKIDELERMKMPVAAPTS